MELPPKTATANRAALAVRSMVILPPALSGSTAMEPPPRKAMLSKVALAILLLALYGSTATELPPKTATAGRVALAILLMSILPPALCGSTATEPHPRMAMPGRAAVVNRWRAICRLTATLALAADLPKRALSDRGTGKGVMVGLGVIVRLLFLCW
jgi:hypothetical protein